jgi:cell division protein FtsW
MSVDAGVLERVQPGGPQPRMATRAPRRRFAGSLGELHRPDYSILVSVVALSLIGILMVYSSSAMRSYVLRDDALAIVAPQILWAAVGLVVMLLLMRVDYRLLRLASVPAYLIAATLLILVFVPGWNRVVGGSARWLVIGPLPAIHPAEIAKLVLVIVLAHWLARRGTKIKRFFGGLVPALAIALPIIALVFKEPDLGTTIVITATAFVMMFVAGARLWQFGALGLAAAAAAVVVGLRGYQIERIRAFLDPWADPTGSGFHTVQGLLALGSGGLFGEGLGQGRMAGGLYLPNAWNDFIFAVIGEEFGFFGAALVVGLFLIFGYAGARTALNAPDTFGALLAVGITGWLAVQAIINIAVVVAVLPVTGITLPFISAGGSSLIISFAAIGILLSISRETIEKGTWNDDATADRRRRDGRAHLPGAGRRALAPRAAGRR